MPALNGSECRDRRRSGAHAAARSATRPAAVRQAEAAGLEQQPDDRTRRGLRLLVQVGVGVADCAASAVVGNGFDGHFAGFRGVPWGISPGLEGRQGAAMRPTRTPSGPPPANRP